MKINPDDPWYPCPFEIRTPVEGCEDIVKVAPGWHPGVTIRLKLAAMMMKSPYLGPIAARMKVCAIDVAFKLADEMIEYANRDEGKD